ncbi:MAG: ATP-binding protein [Bacteroidales bacterium]|jgi:anti-sigma regulatory factor (Ser/Thr protein kinase)|nr:ATP-binding protein [Bacteroidales bacterium]
MKKLFNPIKDKSGEIIECLMSSPDMPTDEDLRFKLRLSIEETVENVVQYAYKDSIGWMEVETNLDEKGFLLTVTLKDAGKKFNPLEMPDPDVNLPLEEREIGGLGIFLCKQFMDEVEYRYEEGCNILTMKKNIAKQ